MAVSEKYAVKTTLVGKSGGHPNSFDLFSYRCSGGEIACRFHFKGLDLEFGFGVTAYAYFNTQ